ncbi:MAG TPA: TIGR01244 family sulfur transferase [Caldimonas sp.]|nr:TIGR01244 family sulfur transferase [Caldimonas sp.]
MGTPHVQQLDATIAVAPQLEPQDLAWAANAGYRSVINNRPDFEGGPDQPTSAQIEAAAKAAGLAYAFLPVASGYQSPDEVERFAQLLETLPKPILAFCRSGARSGRLVRSARDLGR